MERPAVTHAAQPPSPPPKHTQWSMCRAICWAWLVGKEQSVFENFLRQGSNNETIITARVRGLNTPQSKDHTAILGQTDTEPLLRKDQRVLSRSLSFTEVNMNMLFVQPQVDGGGGKMGGGVYARDFVSFLGDAQTELRSYSTQHTSGERVRLRLDLSMCHLRD